MLLLKTSITLPVTLMIVSEYPCFELKVFVDKVVPTPLLCLFRGINSNYRKENCDKDRSVEESRKEHGSFNLFGNEKNDDSNEVPPLNDISKDRVIYPGTKWCGNGNISDSNGDLGRFWETDSCCREHDLCPEYIKAGKTSYGLMNTGSFTRSHCDCDRKFYNCLKNIGTLTSKAVAFGYFTVLRPQCFKEDYPIVGCARKENRKCVQYKHDIRRAKKYQWFDTYNILGET